jgi:tetratricopeptide (TPR) repeat protein
MRFAHCCKISDMKRLALLCALAASVLARGAADAAAVARQAEQMYRQGRVFEAAQAVDSMLRENPDCVPALKLQAMIADLTEKDSAKAERILLRLTQLAPQDAEVWKTLGVYHAEREKGAQAVECLRRAVDIAPTVALYHAALGYAYGLTSEEEESDREFSLALRLNRASPRPDPQIHIVHGDSLVARARGEEAVDSFSRAIDIDDSLAEAFYKRAVAHNSLGQLGDAERDVRQAIRLGGEQRGFYVLLAGILSAAERIEDAKTAAKRAEELALLEEAGKERNRKLRAALDRVESLMHAEKYTEAAREYEALVAAAPGYAEGWFGLAVCYSQTARAKDAEKAVRQYIQLQPASADGHAVLAALLVQQGRAIEAGIEAEEALRLEPSHEEAKRLLEEARRRAK